MPSYLFLQSDHSWQALFCFSRTTKPGHAHVGRCQPLGEGGLDEFSKIGKESPVPMHRHWEDRPSLSNDELPQQPASCENWKELWS